MSYIAKEKDKMWNIFYIDWWASANVSGLWLMTTKNVVAAMLEGQVNCQQFKIEGTVPHVR